MNQHDGSNGISLKPLPGKGGFQNHVFPFMGHRLNCFKGEAVTNRGATLPDELCPSQEFSFQGPIFFEMADA